MAIKPNTNYPAKTTAPSPSYPYGGAQNVTAPGDGTGTPWEQAIVNDIFGLFQKLLDSAAVVPSGNPDTVLLSDYFDSLEKLFSRYTMFTDTGAADTVEIASISGADPEAYSNGQRVGFYVNTNNTGATTLEVAALGPIDFQYRGGGAFIGGELVAGEFIEAVYNTVGPRFELANDHKSGNTVQVVSLADGEVATGTTTVPFDDTIPQNTEGDQYMQLAITPRKATNRLTITVVSHLSATNIDTIISALFQDAIASAIAVGWAGRSNIVGGRTSHTFTHSMVAGTTSPITFKVRSGTPNAGTTTFNGAAGARLYGGVLASSITITETEV